MPIAGTQEITKVFCCKCNWSAKLPAHASTLGIEPINTSDLPKRKSATPSGCPTPTAISSSIKELPVTQNQKPCNCKTSAHSAKIKGLLDQPVPSTAKAHNVTSVVNRLLSRSEKPSQQKYVVMPVIQSCTSIANGATSQPCVKYVLVNANFLPQCFPKYNKTRPSERVTNCAKATLTKTKAMPQQRPLFIEPRQISGQTQHFHTQIRHNSGCCKAVISSNLDTVAKWLDCNRDMVRQTLLKVSEKLYVVDSVSALFSKFRGRTAEHIALKWIGIALMLLTKHQIMQAIGMSGKPIPSSLYYMWSNVRNFFAIYEGCLRLVKAQRSSVTSYDTLEALSMEDNTFKEVLGRIFTEYNRYSATHPVPTGNLIELAKFIEVLEDEQGTHNLDKRSRTGYGITSVLNNATPFQPCLYGLTWNSSTQ